MKKTLSTMVKILWALSLLTFAVSVYADGADNFKADVNAAIDDGLAYSRANNYFTSNNNSVGLSLLTLLEKESIPAGYDGLDAADKLLAENAACILIDSASFGDRASFYSYYDGQVLMGLSVYLDTGGPDEPTAAAGFNCTGRSAMDTIDKVTDRAIAAQQTSGVCSGYWGYTGSGCDSSTTQFTLAGLAAAKSFYIQNVPLSPRIAQITDTLDRTSDGYSANGKDQTGEVLFDSCGSAAQGCYGHGYQANYAANQNSPQQTASGTWGQLVGPRNLNSPSVQRYLRWLQNAYNPTTNLNWAGYFGGYSYFYFLWSSSKAYNIIQNSGLSPDPGNISPADMGTLPTLTSGSFTRIVNRVPANDARPAPRGVGAAGYYAGYPAGWYYDYAYQLMSLQQGSGLFPLGSWAGYYSDHAYAILVLQRSLGGACIDTDGDGICDSQDNCPSEVNPDQGDRDSDGVGDVCDNCPDTFNPDQADSNGNGIGDACEQMAPTCDVDGDGDIDRMDLSLISRSRNQPAQVDDPADANGDGMITVADVKACIPRCTLEGCAVQ